MIRPEFRYNSEDHSRYKELGYCLFERFLTDDALVECRNSVQAMLDELRSEHAPEGIIGAHQRGADWILRLASQAPLLDLIECHVGPNIVLWTSHLVCKPPRTGKAIPWHQDAPYWNVSGRLAGGVWIPFDDVGRDNAAMTVLPGWHQRGTLPRLRNEAELFSEEIDPVALPADVDRQEKVYGLQAGALAVHDPMLPHHSLPNTSPRPRRVLTLRYMNAEGAMGENTYRDHRTGEVFAREYYLVRGKDVLGRGLKSFP
jgi:hypothetical protein